MTLQELLTTAGLSQEDLAIAVGVTQPTVSRWESVNHIPKTDKLMLLSEVLGVTVQDLLNLNRR